ncbi:MAG: hypothetical protein KDB80_16505 [Planctomycetes bacterium]|nr:hypothetical protein [Planctomycetota bacterium]
MCAGYPWFGEWGRDTFLSLPGLTLARGRPEVCRAVIDGALPFLRAGLLPNIYGTSQSDSHYGSVDAALWFARAVSMFVESGHADPDRVRRHYLPALREIASSYRDGTSLGIGADDGGLIAAGGPELNATWMDARTAEGPVTPRDGCAVEINALWYALLDLLAELETADSQARKWRSARDLAGETFLERFWLDDGRYLADRWFEGEPDRKVRPNMVLAAALARSPLTRSMRQDVVGRAHDELLTPRGLRTLSPADPDYIGTYGGGCDERDHAYHQGTVWPWLLGFYTEAALRAFGASEIPTLRRIWSEVLGQLDEAGLEHLSEVFSGDEPYEPGGTIAQAWNTAECLRAARLLDDPRWR